MNGNKKNILFQFNGSGEQLELVACAVDGSSGCEGSAAAAPANISPDAPRLEAPFRFISVQRQ